MSSEQVAGKLWRVLVDLARQRRTTHYSEVAPRVGTYHRSLSRPLGLIQAHCAERALPPLTILVTRKGSRGQLGAGFESWRHEDHDRAREAVFEEDWGQLNNPWGWSKQTGLSARQLVARLLRGPVAGEDVVRLVKARDAVQSLLRDALFEVYDGACAFCGLTFPDALEAAHLVPWSSASPLERGDVRNGLLLCATHHRLFDAGELWIDSKWKLRHHPYPSTAGPYTRLDKQLTSALLGLGIRMPKRAEHRPLPEYVQRRNQLVPARRAPSSR